ncbi:hypothetical protein N1851_034439 [Merluccius polli]|uniref:Nuclease HARBI1 n=1 Tax=Merluccius polli TaxID=89951 RepID=A0AA47NMG4_MERPO|nr:hypothetical protein N1851_034439 [Merluccius polli]
MKCRFHVLHSEIRLSPERASTVITVCAILHNLCKRRNIPQPDEDDDHNDDGDDGDDHDEFGRVEQSGLAFRDHFVNTHFRTFFCLFKTPISILIFSPIVNRTLQQQEGEERQGVHKEGEEEGLGEEVQQGEEELGEEVQQGEEELGEEVQQGEEELGGGEEEEPSDMIQHFHLDFSCGEDDECSFPQLAVVVPKVVLPPLVVQDVLTHQRNWNKPRREGPFKVTNATPTAIEVGGSSTWYLLNHCRKDAQPKTREDRKEELGAGVPGSDRPPQDQTQPSQEQQPHDDAEADGPATDPLRALVNSTDPEKDPEEE